MKNLARLFYILLVVSLVGCTVVSDQVTIHDELVAAYQKAQTDVMNANNTLFTAFTEINLQVQLQTLFENAEIQRTEEYRKYLQAQQDFQALMDAYNASGNQGDLAAMDQSGLSPEALSDGFTLYVNAFTEAQMIAVNEQTRINLQRTVSEKFNEITAASRTANESIQAYNTARIQLKDGRIAGEIANELGITVLPSSLPLYSLGVAPALAPVPTLSTP